MAFMCGESRAMSISTPAIAIPVSSSLGLSRFCDRDFSRGKGFRCRSNIPSLTKPGLRLCLSRTRQRRPGTLVTAREGNNGDEKPEFDGEKDSVDWDKAWSSFNKPQKKKTFLKMDMEKYVSRRPKHSNYPLSEEVDPLRKSERSVLSSWTSMKFTYALIFVIAGLAVYMVIIVGPPPQH